MNLPPLHMPLAEAGDGLTRHLNGGATGTTGAEARAAQ